jgi:hypothetical protein
MRIQALALWLCFFAACSKSSPPPSSPDPVGAGAPIAPATLTAAACEAQSGQVVGDIGDGAVHRPDYRCPSGSPPLGAIVADPGGPVAIEGAVCCAK